MRARSRHALVLLLALAVGGCSHGSARRLVRAKEGQRAPTFDVPGVRDANHRVVLTDFRGRPVVVNFFASWCVPCRREMPALEAVHKRVGDKVAFVGIDHQDTRAAGDKLLRQTGVTYAAGFDPEGEIATAYRLIGMPSTVFIAADGRLLAKHLGEIKADQLRDAIKQLFGVDVGG